LGFRMEHPPDLGRDPCRAIDRLLRRGLRHPRSPIVPVGLLLAAAGTNGQPDFRVVVNPRPEDPVVGSKALGFVAIADNFGSIRAFAESQPRSPAHDEPEHEVDGAPLAIPPPPALARTSQTTIGRVLVCGFRRGSIYMLEELLRGQTGGEVLVLVEDEETLQRARDALDEHSQLVERGLMPDYHGTFTLQPDG